MNSEAQENFSQSGVVRFDAFVRSRDILTREDVENYFRSAEVSPLPPELKALLRSTFQDMFEDSLLTKNSNPLLKKTKFSEAELRARAEEFSQKLLAYSCDTEKMTQIDPGAEGFYYGMEYSQAPIILLRETGDQRDVYESAFHELAHMVQDVYGLLHDESVDYSQIWLDYTKKVAEFFETKVSVLLATLRLDSQQPAVIAAGSVISSLYVGYALLKDRQILRTGLRKTVRDVKYEYSRREVDARITAQSFVNRVLSQSLRNQS